MSSEFEQAIATAEDIVRESGYALPVAWAISFLFDNQRDILMFFAGTNIADHAARLIGEIKDFEQEFSDKQEVDNDNER